MGNSKNGNNDHEELHTVLDDSYDEETSAEIADPDIHEEDHDDPDIKSVYGWIAIALSVVSFFFIPILFAGAGVILGFIARNKDAPILGNTAIVISVISVLFRLFILPLI